MKIGYRLFTIYLQYTSAHMADGLLHLSFLEKRLTRKGSFQRIIVDNAFSSGERKSIAGLTVFGGDNRYHEFSGWEVGLELLERSCMPADNDVILIANDSFFRNYDPALQRNFKRRHMQLAAYNPCAIGVVDSFPEPMHLDGVDQTSWVRSNCFIINYGLLKKIRPMYLNIPPSMMFTSEDLRFFKPECNLELKYQAYLRVWLFGEETDLLAYNDHWYKSQPLNETNYALFVNKAYSIICEHALSRRIIEHFGWLIDIGPIKENQSLWSRIKRLIIRKAISTGPLEKIEQPIHPDNKEL